MKILQIQIKKSTSQRTVQNIQAPRIVLKTLGYIHLYAKNRVQTVKGAVKLYATKTALKISKTMAAGKAILRKAQEYKQAFSQSLKAVSLERAIQAKKALLKYGYSFEKIVDVCKAYMALRSFKMGLTMGVKSLIF